MKAKKKITDHLNYLKQLGIKISDLHFFKQKIAYYGYDEIVTQYLSHFVKRQQLIRPTDFRDIYDFYELDQHLKNNLMIAVELFEQTFKTALIQEITAFPEPNQLLRPAYILPSGRVIRRGDLKDRIRYLNKHFAKPVANYPDRLTTWVLIKAMSFGIATNYFFLLPPKMQNQVLQTLFVGKIDLAEFIKISTEIKLFRNRAAHNYRLLGFKQGNFFLYPLIHLNLTKLKNQEPLQLANESVFKLVQKYLQKHSSEKDYLQKVLYNN